MSARAAFCVLLAALAGCSLAKPPSRPEVLAGALPATTTIPSQWSSSAGPGDVAGDWLLSFDDPRLAAIVSEAVANNLDLRQAAARVAVARETVVVVGAKLLPQVGFKLGAAATDDDGPGGASTGTSAIIGVAWEPDIWGKLRA